MPALRERSTQQAAGAGLLGLIAAISLCTPHPTPEQQPRTIIKITTSSEPTPCAAPQGKGARSELSLADLRDQCFLDRNNGATFQLGRRRIVADSLHADTYDILDPQGGAVIPVLWDRTSGTREPQGEYGPTLDCNDLQVINKSDLLGNHLVLRRC